MYGSRLPLESTDIEIPEIESSRPRRDPQRARVPRQCLANRRDAGSLCDFGTRGTRMRDADNTRLVHTTINRR